MSAYSITKHIDHVAYPAKCRRMSDAELLFTAHDARMAVDAYPDGPNVGYYLDEICYCSDELARRARGGARKIPTLAETSAEIVRAALAAAE